jgi:hypothetical protein
MNLFARIPHADLHIGKCHHTSVLRLLSIVVLRSFAFEIILLAHNLADVCSASSSRFIRIMNSLS